MCCGVQKYATFAIGYTTPEIYCSEGVPVGSKIWIFRQNSRLVQNLKKPLYFCKTTCETTQHIQIWAKSDVACENNLLHKLAGAFRKPHFFGVFSKISQNPYETRTSDLASGLGVCLLRFVWKVELSRRFLATCGARTSTPTFRGQNLNFPP